MIHFFDYFGKLLILTQFFQCFSKRHCLNYGLLKKEAACLTIKPVLTELRSSQVSFNTYERVKGDNRTNMVFMKRLHGAVIVALKRNVTFNLTTTVCAVEGGSIENQSYGNSTCTESCQRNTVSFTQCVTCIRVWESDLNAAQISSYMGSLMKSLPLLRDRMRGYMHWMAYC